jgi:uncharacterized protein (TIGR00251 family)
MKTPFLTPVAGGVRLRVRLQPRGSRNRIVGRRGDALKAQVTAAPVDGEANAALERLLAAAASVPRSTVRVVRGAKSRDKIVEVATTDAAAIAARLERLVDEADEPLR